jgi:hypothetical protein
VHRNGNAIRLDRPVTRADLENLDRDRQLRQERFCSIASGDALSLLPVIGTMLIDSTPPATQSPGAPATSICGRGRWQ